MSALREYIGGCEACDETMHVGDVGAACYAGLGLGYCVLCESCARIPGNASFLVSPIGPLVACDSGWQRWTVLQ